MIKVDAFILSYKREENLEKVVAGIKKQSFVRDIYIFHNYPSSKKIDGVYNIFSERNFGCFARHVFALMTSSEYNFFIDDDIELLIDFSDRFSDAINKNPTSVIGFFGRNINSKNLKHCYTEKKDFFWPMQDQYVDIVGGVHLCSNSCLLDSVTFVRENFNKINGLNENTFIEDDIVLNLSTQLKKRVPSYLVSHSRNEIRFLSKDFALTDEVFHFYNRNIIAREFIEKFEWNSMIDDKYKIFNKDKNIKLYDFVRFVQKYDIDNAEKIYYEIKNNIMFLYQYNFGSLLFEKRRFIKSETVFLDLIENFNNSESSKILALAFYKLGEIYLKRNQIKIALHNYRECIQLMPEHKKCKERIMEYESEII